MGSAQFVAVVALRRSAARPIRGIRPVRLAAAVVALVTMLTLSACSIPGVYVVEKPGAAGGPKAFDAATYVNGIWASKVVPAVTGTKNDAGTVLTAIAADPKTAQSQFGKQSGDGGAFTYLVKGTGTVTSVDTESPVGRMQVAVDGGPKKVDVYLAVGPAFVGSAIRDGVGFIDFSQFINQIDYADVSTALNDKVKTTVVNTVDLASAKGKKVSFAGAFSVIDPTAVIVTPVQLTVGP